MPESDHTAGRALVTVTLPRLGRQKVTGITGQFFVQGCLRVTATVTATAANYGELQRTFADERTRTHIQGERRRTVANSGERKNTVLKTTWAEANGRSQ